MDWEIRAHLGKHVRTGVDAHGWRWEITRGAEVAQVVIEISGRAWSSDPRSLPEDTRHALETDGHAELLKVLDQDDPPRVIRCGYSGCSYLSADELVERPSRT
jgi:hypothetical protein